MTISDGLDRPGQNNQSRTIDQAQKSTDSTSPAESPNQLPLVPSLLDARCMPDVYGPFAPCFDGQPHLLARYLHDIELLGRNCRLSPEELIWYSIHYLGSEEAEKWKAHASNVELEGGDWENFKAGIMLLYPGSGDFDPYAATQLEVLVRDCAAVPIRDLLQYDEYYPQFSTIADFLQVDRGFISQRNCGELFLAGFHVNVRDPVKLYLDQSHTPSELLTVTEIDRTAGYVLQWDSALTPEVAFSTVNPQFNSQPSYTYPLPSQPFQSTPLVQPDQPAQSLRSTLMTPVSQESLDMESLKQFLTSDAFLNRIVDKLAAKLAPASAVPLQAYLPRPNQPRYTRPVTTCRACSDPTHFIRYCPKVVDYVLRGRCVKDQNNRICLPDGTLVTTRLAPGKDILERVDNWHRAHPAAPLI